MSKDIVEKTTSFIVTKLKSGFIVRTETSRKAVSTIEEVITIVTPLLHLLNIISEQTCTETGHRSLLINIRPTTEEA